MSQCSWAPVASTAVVADPPQPGSGRRSADADLVRRVRNGDLDAWDEIVARHQGLLWWLARQFRLTNEDAADVVQLTWLRCLEHLHQLGDAQAFSGWLGTICRRECLRMATRRSTEVLLADPDEPQHRWADPGSAGGDPYDVVARQDELARLHQAIASLPTRARQVVLALLEHEGEGYAEVARQLGVPVGSLGPTRSRALAKLRVDPRLAVADR